jgi:hypothetical protein
MSEGKDKEDLKEAIKDLGGTAFTGAYETVSS